MERPVTLHECRQAIHRLGLAKSAGPDGLPAEFYKSFEDLVGLSPAFESAYALALAHVIGFGRACQSALSPTNGASGDTDTPKSVSSASTTCRLASESHMATASRRLSSGG
eukprot:scaffold26237_cov107-Isochrysis_galbana.AAC.1